jgi:hypothetical protein
LKEPPAFEVLFPMWGNGTAPVRRDDDEDRDEEAFRQTTEFLTPYRNGFN